MKITPELLKKYAEGRCSPAERKAIEEWKNATTDIKPSVPSEGSAPRKQRIWVGIEQETHVGKEKINPGISWAIAACVAVLVVGTGIGLFNLFDRELTTYATAYGETQLITLEDGTLVTLNANSLLTITENFGEGERLVRFAGEAYFQVAKNPEKPFIVETQDARTQVIGTAFNLNAIKDRPTTLTLQEGKVAFSTRETDNDQILVLPNEQVTVVNGSLVKREVKPETVLLWTTGKLFFDNETLNTIGQALQNLYGVRVEIEKGDLPDKRFRGVVNNKDMTSLLTELAFVMEFQFTEHEDGSIRIY